MHGSSEPEKNEQATMKDRISTCALASTKKRLELEPWMLLRKKAVVEMPEARAHHVGAVLGAGLFVHGGQNSEGGKTIGDWNLFDFGLQVWINCFVQEMVLPDKTLQTFNYTRKYHTMTVVVDPALSTGSELTRVVWASPAKELMRKQKVIETGFYCFGGINEAGEQNDDLIWLYPNFKANEKIISSKHGEYKPSVRPEVKFLAKKLTPEGRGPIARSQHSTTFFKGKLVIFGGRNDDIFPVIKNVALNDLHIYEVDANRWATIAMYGEIPGSRWGHRLVSNDNKIMLFGGMNLNFYCESVVYDIHISKCYLQQTHLIFLFTVTGNSAVYDFLSKPVGLKPEQQQNNGSQLQNMQLTTEDDEEEENKADDRSVHRHESSLSRYQRLQLQAAKKTLVGQKVSVSIETRVPTIIHHVDSQAEKIVANQAEVKVPAQARMGIIKKRDSVDAIAVSRQLQVLENEIFNKSGQTVNTDRLTEQRLDNLDKKDREFDMLQT